MLPDDHPLCVAAARSKLERKPNCLFFSIILLFHRVLREADVILLIGARLNWILHFGRPPRFDPNVKVIQV